MSHSHESSDEDHEQTPSRLSSWGEQVLLVGVVWSTFIGIVLGISEGAIRAGLVAVAIALLYSALVCWFRRRAIWGAIALLVAAVLILNPAGMGIENYLICMVLGINFLLFGEFGIQLLALDGSLPFKENRQQAFWKLSASLIGSLTLGWVVGAYFGYQSITWTMG